MEYLPRIVDAELSLLLEASGAVLIEGPKACGKTETASRAASSEVRLDRDENAKLMVDLDVGAVLAGDTPRLIDEWQLAPSIWNHVRHEVDRRRSPGQFILTGSAKPADDYTRHSGAGRFSRLQMRPFTLKELGAVVELDFTCQAAPKRAAKRRAQQEMTISSLAEILCAGRLAGKRGQARRLRQFAPTEAMSGKSATLTSPKRAASHMIRSGWNDCCGHWQEMWQLPWRRANWLPMSAERTVEHLNPDTAAEYLEALTRLMVVEDQPAWSPKLRSRTRLRAAAVRHFVDPSLAVAALGIAPDRLLADLNYFGIFVRVAW